MEELLALRVMTDWVLMSLQRGRSYAAFGAFAVSGPAGSDAAAAVAALQAVATAQAVQTLERDLRSWRMAEADRLTGQLRGHLNACLSRIRSRNVAELQGVLGHYCGNEGLWRDERTDWHEVCAAAARGERQAHEVGRGWGAGRVVKTTGGALGVSHVLRCGCVQRWGHLFESGGVVQQGHVGRRAGAWGLRLGCSNLFDALSRSMGQLRCQAAAMQVVLKATVCEL